MAEGGKSESVVGSAAPALFPVSARGCSSSTVASRLFPSFASAPSVFPIVHNAGPQHEPALQWLSNSSFSEALLPPLPETHTSDVVARVEVDRRDILGSNDAQMAGAAASSDLDLSAEEYGKCDTSRPRERSKKKRRQKRKEEERRVEKHIRTELKIDADVRKIGVLDGTAVERRAAVSNWADVNASLPKEYYFDTHGDPNNLAFGSVYKMDVARYRRQEVGGLFGEVHGRRFVQRSRPLDFEGDGLIQDDVVRTDRYWSPKFASLERKRKLKRLKIHSRKSERKYNGQKLPCLGEFVPLDTGRLSKEDKNSLIEESNDEGQTWQEYVALKTKEFNQHTRERPHDESLWIRFAEFQDESIQATEKESVIRQLVEKKIAILEKGLGLNKDSEDLLILYLETCRRREDAGILLSKWQHAVSRHSGSLRMWREFLHFQCAQFSSFSVSSLRTMYNHALQALTASRNRLRSKGMEEGKYDEDFVDAELAMVSIFVDLCRFNWQTGHHELAVGLFEAEIEYNLFAPPIQLSESSKRRLFEAFWVSGAPRFGEDTGLGWVTWLEKEEEQVQKSRENLSNEAQIEEDQTGGWTGWSAPGEELADFDGKPQLSEDESDEMEDDVEIDTHVLQEEEDDAALLEKLGLSLDSSTKVEVKDTRIWKRWSEREKQRDTEQWLPLHSQFPKKTGNSEAHDNGEDDQLERIVLFEDIQESLFSLQSHEARSSMIYQFIDFCDGPLSQWCCSNKRSYISKLESLDSLKGELCMDMSGAKWHERELSLAKLVVGSSWYQRSKGRAKFLHNCLGLVRPVFPRDRLLLDALLKSADSAIAET